jgi:hypothetical protein
MARPRNIFHLIVRYDEGIIELTRKRKGKVYCILEAIQVLLQRQRKNVRLYTKMVRLCGLVVRVLGYGSRGPGSITGTTRFFEK